MNVLFVILSLFISSVSTTIQPVPPFQYYKWINYLVQISSPPGNAMQISEIQLYDTNGNYFCSPANAWCSPACQSSGGLSYSVTNAMDGSTVTDFQNVPPQATVIFQCTDTRSLRFYRMFTSFSGSQSGDPAHWDLFGSNDQQTWTKLDSRISIATPSTRGANYGPDFIVDECAAGTHNCAVGQTCTDGGMSFTCPCSAGYTGTGSCTACPAGTFKSTVGSAACVACPANSNSPSGSPSCPCNVGYTGPDSGTCYPCLAGQYKDVAGSTPCNACPANTYNSMAATTLNSCSCNAGYTGAGGNSCTQCTVGTYKDIPGAGTCMACPVGSVGYLARANLQECGCAPGYTGSGGSSCLQCPAGTYKSNIGPDNCLTCPPNTYSTAVGATSPSVCQPCPALTQSPSGSSMLSSCVCAAGATGPNGGPCSPCPYSTYKAATGSANCQNCPVATDSGIGSWSSSFCKCQPGYTGADGGPCNPCPAGQYKERSGSYPCDICPMGTYNSNVGSTSLTACLPCPDHSTTTITGAAYITSCVCSRGYYGISGGLCAPCPPQTYGGGTSVLQCLRCPSAGNYVLDGTSECGAWCPAQPNLGIVAVATLPRGCSQELQMSTLTSSVESNRGSFTLNMTGAARSVLGTTSDTVYVGGALAPSNDLTGLGLATVSSGSPGVLTMQPSPTGSVRAMAYLDVGGAVLIGGLFSNAILQQSGGNWVPTALPQLIPPCVLAIATVPGGSDFFVGGCFTTDGANSLNGIAYASGVSDTTWSPLRNGCTSIRLSSTLGPSGSSAAVVHCLASWGPTKMFVGGSFDYCGGFLSGAACLWDMTVQDWIAMPGLKGSIKAAAAGIGVIYVAGELTSFGNLAQWRSNSGWSTISNGVTGAVHSILLQNKELFVGGNFFVPALGNGTRSVAAWDPMKNTWRTVYLTTSTAETVNAISNTCPWGQIAKRFTHLASPSTDCVVCCTPAQYNSPACYGSCGAPATILMNQIIRCNSAWSLVMRTVWQWGNASALLQTNCATFKTTTIGSIEINQPYRLAANVWSSTMTAGSMLVVLQYRFADGTSCGPFQYQASGITFSSFASTSAAPAFSGTVIYNPATVTLLSGAGLAFSTTDCGLSSSSCVNSNGAVPWSLGACCSFCPTIGGTAWSNVDGLPHPSIVASAATTADMYGLKPSVVCTGHGGLQGSTGTTYYGLNSAEIYLQ